MFACDLLFKTGLKDFIISASFRLQDVNSTIGRTIGGVYTFLLHMCMLTYVYTCRFVLVQYVVTLKSTIQSLTIAT